MPTALELGPAGWSRYSPKTPLSKSSVSETEDRERLFAVLREKAAVLRADFGAARVILFGSLARGLGFEPQSDVDVAVEGMKGDYWQAWGVLEEAIPSRAVELLELEAASPSLRAAIESEGVEI